MSRFLNRLVSKSHAGEDPRDDFIAQVVRGRSFCDVGGLWGTDYEKVSVAHAAGASRLAMMDVTPAGTELWNSFHARLDSLGVSGVESISADVKSVGTTHRFDVVHCSGVIYHVPDPLEALAGLRRISSEHLIVSSAVVPDHIENAAGELSFAPGQLLFVPHLEADVAAVIRQHFTDHGIDAWGVTETVAQWALDDFGPWWWLFTTGVLRQMLLATGLEIIDEAPGWGGRAQVFLTRCP